MSQMALFDRSGGSLVWSLSGEELTSGQSAHNDAIDPQRPIVSSLGCDAARAASSYPDLYDEAGASRLPLSRRAKTQSPPEFRR